MTTAPIFTPIRFQPDDIAGVPLAGAVLAFFQAGTTTPITVYSDSGLITSLGSSVTADGQGAFQPIYLAAQFCKTTLTTSAGVLVQTVDNITVGVGDATIVLKQSAAPAPTAEGDIQWDTDDDRIAIGAGGTTVTFSNDTYNAAHYPTFPVSLAHGGTAGTSQITGWDGLSAQGTDIASAATIVLTTATGPRVNVTGTTGVTAITLAVGDWRIIKTTGVITFTASASLLVNGQSSSYTYASAAGEFFFVSGETGQTEISTLGRPAKTQPQVVATMNTAVSAGNVLTTWTEVTDRSNEFDNTTGIFVASQNGDYLVTASVLSNTAGQNTLSLDLDTGSGFSGITQARVQAANYSMIINRVQQVTVGHRMQLRMVDGSVAASGTLNSQLTMRLLP